MSVKAKGISPEILAVITAAACQLMGTDNLAVRITRPSTAWAMAGRQKNMNNH